ncbi:MAG: glycosyltransferase [bacterium]|nr:glycosyltransferase [bacterium]
MLTLTASNSVSIKTPLITALRPELSNLKVAIVHDYLNQFGGQERVLLNLLELFPNAPVYTLIYDKSVLGKHLNGTEVHTSILDNPLVRKYHRLFIPLLGHAAETINLKDEYDLIITNTMGFVKGVRYSRGINIAYNHAPLRYAWEPHVYLKDMFPKFMIYAGMPALRYVRWQDKRFSQKPDYMLANSNYIASKLKQFYGRDATVLYPPIEDHIFNYDPQIKREDYFLAFGRMIHYKKFPLVVEAFKKNGLPLKVVGSGPDEGAVKRAAGGATNIEVLPFMETYQLRDVVRKARATVIPQLEDFGLTTVESIACGTPVVGYNQGGTAEIITDGQNGILFSDQTVDGLRSAIERFEKTQFEPERVAKSALRFAKANFQERFVDLVMAALKKE